MDVPLGGSKLSRWVASINPSRLALAFSLVGVILSLIVTFRVFEAIPHLEDEFAYVWQAEVANAGRLTIPSPPQPNSFLVPFVIDHNGLRFGKYPLGWPVLLAVGIRLGVRWLVNPLLAGLGVWLTYRIGQRAFNPLTGLLAAGLTITSPFYLMNSGSLLSHPLGLVLSAAFALVWLDGFVLSQERRWLPTITLGLLIIAQLITRPYTAIAVITPFALHGFYLMIRGDKSTRLHLLVVAALGIIGVLLYLAWQASLTGDPFLNPYTLWWPYDKVGFGPGHGLIPGGHSLRQAYINTKASLAVGAQDLFGWWYLSYLFLPFGLWAARKNGKALLISAPALSLLVFYLAYWVGADLYGPRYYYESLYSLTLLTAAGILWLAGVRVPGISTPGGITNMRRFALVSLLVAGLVGANIFYFAPKRLSEMYGLYTIKASAMDPFRTEQAQEFTPALVIVHVEHWMPYGALLELEDPFLTTPFIFAIDLNARLDANLAKLFPDRTILHYYPDTPGQFYAAPRP